MGSVLEGGGTLTPATLQLPGLMALRLRGSDGPAIGGALVLRLLSAASPATQCEVAALLLVLLEANPANKRTLCLWYGLGPLLCAAARCADDETGGALRLHYLRLAASLGEHSVPPADALTLILTLTLTPTPTLTPALTPTPSLTPTLTPAFAHPQPLCPAPLWRPVGVITPLFTPSGEAAVHGEGKGGRRGGRRAGARLRWRWRWRCRLRLRVEVEAHAEAAIEKGHSRGDARVGRQPPTEPSTPGPTMLYLTSDDSPRKSVWTAQRSVCACVCVCVCVCGSVAVCFSF